jgi:sulfite reductase (NADPH) flavoprotein alpha-component
MVVDPRMKRVELPGGAPFNPVQRAWLEGFIAGFAVPGAGAAARVAAAPPPPLTIIYASQTGTAESLAKKLAKAAKAKGFTARAVDVETLDLDTLAGFGDLAVVASTHGEGDPPDPAMRFADVLKAASGTPLAGVRFAVLALGDSNYARFCGFGRWLDERFGELGGERMFERIDCDVEVDEPFAAFRETVLARLAEADGSGAVPAVPALAVSDDDEDEDTGAQWTRNRPFAARLLDAAVLNKPGSDKETRHVALSLAGSDIAYEPGDALGVVPTNDPASVDAVLAASDLSGDAPVTIAGATMDLRTALTGRLSIGKLSQATLIKFQAKAESADLVRLVEPDNVEEREAWLWGREFIDLLTGFPGVVTSADDLVSMLPKLAPRLYSIASSQRAHPDAVHLTIGVVRYEAWGRARGGIASTEIADRMPVGAEVPVYLHPNTRFRLPIDPNRSVIMIGPGTGIAPFRAFLQERRETGAKGRNWLFFGDRRAACDYLYREELRAFGKDGVLTRIDTAFSRDQIDKVYVQHLMLEAGAEIWRWIEDGAHVYVCGDSSRMARDVDDALLTIVSEHGRMSPAKARLELQQLAADRRYCRDVY